MTLAPEDRIAKAQKLMESSQAYEAIRELEMLIEEEPRNFQALVLLGFVNFKLGAINRGREFMNRAFSCAPTKEDANKIRTILQEQDHLDKRRHYRPDFEALRKQNKE